MKNLMIYSFIIILLSISCVSNPPNQEVQYYKSKAEAINSGISNLKELYTKDIQVDIGIMKEQIENISSGKAINYLSINFAELLESDTSNIFGDMLGPDKSEIIPVNIDNTVVSVIEIGESEQGWYIKSLGGKIIANDLAELKNLYHYDDLSIYFVPNLRVNVYEQKQRGIPELYSLKMKNIGFEDTLNNNSLIQILRVQARSFEAKYGKELQKKRIVD